MILILGLSTVAGCDSGSMMMLGMALGSSDSTPAGPTVGLTVVNQGTVPVRVQIVADHVEASPSDIQEVVLAPSESTFLTFGDVSLLRVRVLLVSSLTMLFYEAWDQAELSGLGNQVTVTVTP
jgi:hypothetical protein